MRRNAGRQFIDRGTTARRLAQLVEADPELREPEAFAAAFEYVTGFRPGRAWLRELVREVELELERRRRGEPLPADDPAAAPGAG